MIYDGLIFYSSFFPDEKNIFRGEKFLTTMLERFGNHLIFVGIQTKTTTMWLDMLETYKEKGLNIVYEFCNPELYVNSDVAGYQKAIELFYLMKEKVKIKNKSLVWFGHSKGVTTNVLAYHNWMFPNFWEKNDIIKNRLYENSNYGCYGYHLSFLPIYNVEKMESLWKNYSNIKFVKPPLKYMFTNTFFVIKYDIFRTMIENLNTDFLYKKLESPIEGIGDRYFFERDFIHFVDMMGYEPIFDDYASNVTWKNISPNDYLKHLNEWKLNN